MYRHVSLFALTVSASGQSLVATFRVVLVFDLFAQTRPKHRCRVHTSSADDNPSTCPEGTKQFAYSATSTCRHRVCNKRRFKHMTHVSPGDKQQIPSIGRRFRSYKIGDSSERVHAFCQQKYLLQLPRFLLSVSPHIHQYFLLAPGR